MNLPLLITTISAVCLYNIQANCQWEDSFQPGSYYVIGLYKMYTDYDKSEFDENAIRFHLKMRYFIESTYLVNNNKSMIGYLGFNICNQTSMVESLTHVLLNPYFKPTQSVLKDCHKTYDCKSCKCSGSSSSNILVIVSYLPIGLTRLIANILMSEKIPYLAFANKEIVFNAEYNLGDYFPTNPFMYTSYELGRVLNYINKYNIKHLAIVNIGNFAGDLALYHQAELWKLVLSAQACIQRKFIDPLNITDMKAYINYIRYDETLQMVAIWSHGKDISSFIEMTNNITNKIWFWYTNDYVIQDDIDYKLEKHSLETHFFFRHPAYSYQTVNKKYTYKKMSIYMHKFGFQRILKDRWISDYLKQKGLQENDTEVFKDFDVKSTLDQHYVELLVTLIWHLDPSWLLTDFKLIYVWKWFQQLATVEFVSRIYIEEKNKTRVIISTFIENIDDKMRRLNRKNICEKKSCNAGYEPKYDSYNDTNTMVMRLNWHCVKCAENSIKSGSSKKYCHKCSAEMKSNSNRTTCYDPYINEYLQLTDTIIIVVLSFVFSGCLFNIITILIFLKNKQTPIVRASSLDSSLLHLFVHFLLFTTLPILFLNELSQIKCVVQPILIGTLLTIITTITMTKTLKTLHAFKSSVVISKRSIFLTKMVEWFILFLVVTVQLTIAAITFYQVFPTTKTTRNTELKVLHVYCTNRVHLQIQLSYIFVLSLFCLVQAFRGRNLPNRYNESMRTTYSMLMTILVLGITFPITQSQVTGKIQGVVVLGSITVINFIQLVTMYAYKVFVVIFRAEKNTKESFRLSMMQNAKEAATRRINSVKF